MRGLSLVVLSALLFVLGQPNALAGDGIFFLSFIALAPAFYALSLSPLRRSFFLGFIFGLLVYAGMCYWLSRYDHSLFFLALMAYALLYGFCFFVCRLLAESYPAYSFPVMALVFCSMEYLKTLGPLGFSYGVVGYSQWTFRPLLLAASVGGVWLASCCCVFFSAFVAEALQGRRKRQWRRTLASFLLLVFPTVSFSVVGLCLSRAAVGQKDITVVLVQNNADSTKYAEGSYKKDIALLVSLSEEALSLSPDADFVVWPETAVVPPIVRHYSTRTDRDRFNAVASVLALIAQSRACFVVGNQHVDETGGDCNAALVFDGEQKPVLPPDPGLYAKQHLVPFTETLPFPALLGGLYDRIVPDRSFLWKAGESPAVFSARGISFAVPICFEDSFGSLCAQFVRGGAQCLFSICNDSWAASSVCQRQHLAMAAFRAAENAVPVLRSCASGVSCVIDAGGRVVGELEPFCADSLMKTVSVPTGRRMTPYSFYGDWFAQTELLVLCILCAWTLIKKVFGAVERKRANGVE